MRGFTFAFPNLSTSLKNILQPSPRLTNKETGTEQNTFVPTQYSFFSEQNYKNVPVFHYINESYFLHDKSDLIKETFITALNKKISIYSSISYFNKRMEKKIFKTVTPEEILKFYVNKDTTKNSLSFQLTSVRGKLPKLKDKKIYNLSLTKKEKKQKDKWQNQ